MFKRIFLLKAFVLLSCPAFAVVDVCQKFAEPEDDPTYLVMLGGDRSTTWQTSVFCEAPRQYQAAKIAAFCSEELKSPSTKNVAIRHSKCSEFWKRIGFTDRKLGLNLAIGTGLIEEVDSEPYLQPVVKILKKLRDVPGGRENFAGIDLQFAIQNVQKFRFFLSRHAKILGSGEDPTRAGRENAVNIPSKDIVIINESDWDVMEWDIARKHLLQSWPSRIKYDLHAIMLTHEVSRKIGCNDENFRCSIALYMASLFPKDDVWVESIARALTQADYLIKPKTLAGAFAGRGGRGGRGNRSKRGSFNGGNGGGDFDHLIYLLGSSDLLLSQGNYITAGRLNTSDIMRKRRFLVNLFKLIFTLSVDKGLYNGERSFRPFKPSTFHISQKRICLNQKERVHIELPWDFAAGYYFHVAKFVSQAMVRVRNLDWIRSRRKGFARKQGPTVNCTENEKKEKLR